jgi:hypothetical protein
MELHYTAQTGPRLVLTHHAYAESQATHAAVAGGAIMVATLSLVSAVGFGGWYSSPFLSLEWPFDVQKAVKRVTEKFEKAFGAISGRLS